MRFCSCSTDCMRRPDLVLTGVKTVVVVMFVGFVTVLALVLLIVFAAGLRDVDDFGLLYNRDVFAL